jgi:hypothetical protein
MEEYGSVIVPVFVTLGSLGILRPYFFCRLHNFLFCFISIFIFGLILLNIFPITYLTIVLNAVLVVAFGGKKAQQETIDEIINLLPEFKEYI